MSAKNIRRQLAAIRALLEETPPSAGVDWDALGRGDNERFLASLPELPPPQPSEQELRLRSVLARMCDQLGQTPAELGAEVGMFWGPTDFAPCRPPWATREPPQSGFVQVPQSTPQPEGEQA